MTDNGTPRGILLSLTILTDTPDQAAKAAEVLSRAAAGLVLEGLHVGLHFAPDTGHDES